MTKKSISQLSAFYRQEILATKKVLERIEFSDFQKLPAWVKKDLTEWLGRGSMLAFSRLRKAGMKIKNYKRGDIDSLFPGGMPREKRNFKH